MLWLILAFFNAAGLMVLVGAEFIAMLLVIVYVGAVAVLFLFVVMMLDIDFAELRAGFVQISPLGAVLGDRAGVEMIWSSAPGARAIELGPPRRAVGSAVPQYRSARALLYTDYLFLFEAAGMILLVAMIGAIVLTHRDRTASRSRTSQARSRGVRRMRRANTQPTVGGGIDL